MPLHALLDVRCTAADRQSLRGMSEAGWNDLLELADRHRVMASLNRRMQDPAVAELVPARVRHEIARRHSGARKASLGIRLQLPVILGAFSGKGIPVIALKGAHLAFQVYPDPIDRPMYDVDLLVRPADIQRVIELLGGMEYRPYEFADKEFIPDYDAYIHLAPFVRPSWPTIEIHRALDTDDDDVTLPLDDFWDRARAATFGDATALVLAPEDLLLHVCVHIAQQHRFRIGLRSLQDIPAMISHFGQAFSWRRFVDTSVASGAARGCYYALAVADELIGIDMPESVMAELRPDDAERDQVDLMAWYLMVSMKPQAPVGARELRRAAGPRAIATAIARTVFPGAERMRLVYHLSRGDRRLPLYYAYRPLDLLIRRGHFMLGLLLPRSRAKSALTTDAAAETIAQVLAART